jgi:hypothetical protein
MNQTRIETGLIKKNPFRADLNELQLFFESFIYYKKMLLSVRRFKNKTFNENIK